MIDRITVDKILDAAQIVDVVGDFVTLKRAGANYKGLCPFHDDRTPSFMVSPAKNFCKCFACGKGGSPVGFIMEHEQLSYPDALRWLAKKYGITIEERELTAEEKVSRTERESMLIVNEWANQWFKDQLRNTQEGRNIGMSYFRGRGFRDDTIEKFQLGYSPAKRDACTQAALKAGYQEQYLTSDPDKDGVAHGVGLCIKRDNGTLFDRYAGRVMFPIFSISGKVVGFGGRVLDAATKGVNVKYQNSPESVVYSKRREIYGLFQARQSIAKKDYVIMVEGYTDVISMSQSGVENIVSSSGTALTQEQIRLLRRFTENVVIIYDGDAAGIKASQRGIDMFLREGMNVKLLLLPDGKDPDDFARENTPEMLQQYIEEKQVDFIRFKCSLLMEEAKGDPIKMSNLVNNIVQSIAVIPDEIKRTLYIRETAQLMQLGEHLIADATAKRLKQNIEEWRKERERDEKRRERETSSITPPPQGGEWVPPAPDEGAAEMSPAPIVGEWATLPPPPTEGGAEFPPPPGGEVPLMPPPPTGDASAGRSPAPLSQTPKQKDALYELETLIMQTVVRHGEKIICNVENENGQEEPLSIIEFVFFSLQQDKLNFCTPLYQRMMEEGMEHVREEGFSAERFFLRHPDQTTSSHAFDLSMDKEQLSQFYSKQKGSVQEQYNELMELITHLLTDLKLCIVSQRKKDIMKQMRDPNVLADRTQYRSIMQKFQEIKVLESRLAKACGDRVLS